jgi:hypothetical protein
MGVKGLYSYLNNEPSRFGRRVSLKDCSGIIFIDGPALHYFLIRSICEKSSLPPTESMIDLDDSPTGVVSPNAIYNLTRAFFSYLLSIISEQCQVCVVFDGIAQSYKEEQQLLRIQESYIQYDNTVRSFIENRKVKRPVVSHLFGEDAIAEAMEEFAGPRLKMYHAHGEAETFIFSAIRDSKHNDVLVLSSDSDFLLFPGIPGFVPLQSLEYTADGIEGWEYTRKQFLAAHPNLSDSNTSNEFKTMICIAAFCGCDYRLEPHLQKRLQSAQSIIVKSKIGGLKKRHYQKTSFKDKVLAVLRYMEHFKKKSKMEWFHDMTSVIVNAESEKTSLECRLEGLREALDQIHAIYKGDEEGRGESKASAELQRIIGLQKLYCKPVLELYKADSCPKVNINRDEQQSDGKETKTYQGVWMENSFSSCRDRIYSLLSETHPNLRDSTITEFTRSGGKGQVSLHGIEKFTTYKDNNFDFQHTTELLCMLCAPTLDDTSESSWKYLQELPPYLHGAFLASMMLKERRQALFLYLTMLTSLNDHTSPTMINVPNDRCEYIQALGKCTLAVFHIKLASEAILFVDDRLSLDYIEFKYRNIFSDRKANMIWNAIDEHGTDYDDNIDDIMESLYHSKHFNLNSSVDDVRLLLDAWSKSNVIYNSKTDAS